MRNIKKKIMYSAFCIAVALTLNYGTANADLFLLDNGSKIYNYNIEKEDSKGMTVRNKDGKEIYIPYFKLKGYVSVRDGSNYKADIDEETASKLAEVKSIENWAVERIGLPKFNNFWVYNKNNHKKHHIVYYCDNLKLPKNYFDIKNETFKTKEEALEFKLNMESKDYDVYYRTTSAFSNDPLIYKGLLEHDLFKKIDTVLHENMHGHINLDFCIELEEACAIVVGNFGALEYITEKYGEKSKEFMDATKSIEKNYQDAELIISYYNKLDEVLKSDLHKTEKLKEKERLMNELAEKRSKIYGIKVEKLNNSGLADYITYYRFTPLAKKVYEKAGPIREAINIFKTVSDLAASPQKLIIGGREDFYINYLEKYLVVP